MMLRLLVLASVLSIPIEARTDVEIRYYRESLDQGCLWHKGYTPGGNIMSPGKVVVPKAVLGQQHAMDAIMGMGGKQANILMHSVNTGVQAVGMDNLKKVLPMWSKIAPRLAPVLGVFGAVVAAYVPQTTPDDILESTNRALEELGEEIDKKMDQMTGYVESKITTLERHLIQRDVKVMMNLLLGCLDEPSVFLEECIRESYAMLTAYRPKFAIYKQDITKKREISIFKAKEVEALLPSFQIYANFVLMGAKILVDTYEYDETKTDTTKEQYDTTLRGQQHSRYKHQLKKQLTFFKGYAKNAVNAILKAHNGPDKLGGCLKTHDGKKAFECKHDRDLWSWGSKTGAWYKCTCKMDDSLKQTCELKYKLHTESHWTPAEVRDGGVEKWSYDHGNRLGRREKNCENDLCIIERLAKKRFTNLAGLYQRKSQSVIKEYWNQNLLQSIPSWNKAEHLIKDILGEDAKEKLEAI